MTQMELDIELMKINNKLEADIDKAEGLIAGYRENIDRYNREINDAFRKIDDCKSTIRTIESSKRELRMKANEARIALKQRFAAEAGTPERNRDDHDPYPEE